MLDQVLRAADRPPNTPVAALVAAEPQYLAGSMFLFLDTPTERSGAFAVLLMKLESMPTALMMAMPLMLVAFSQEDLTVVDRAIRCAAEHDHRLTDVSTLFHGLVSEPEARVTAVPNELREVLGQLEATLSDPESRAKIKSAVEVLRDGKAAVLAEAQRVVDALAEAAPTATRVDQ